MTAGFALQFSTGEFVEVRGAGLVGRAPAAEPGERVDQLVPITDPTRSVSKTHLAFGIDDGALWVSDRHSANGTRVESGGTQRRCEPGRRYRVPRGGRIWIGDQFIVVG
ncbi:FHA domain-containing protein [Galbitalea sp. SE-J8]|uniref:FHA domain-containing protein n=1 Tax=Galbitalea sp. SE-J8 TaxID=3054952 RepID=UPI00259C6F22|nr:FHA domain-containing protein [Galbitalea sp. SE-J8]MDM4763481.1 FHA domain-containing protein [Galbitalea sp. SE-J8]